MILSPLLKIKKNCTSEFNPINWSRTTDFSVVVECLEMFDSVNDITLVSVSLGAYSGVYTDKRGRPTDQNI